jgi:hypothetical protein
LYVLSSSRPVLLLLTESAFLAVSWLLSSIPLVKL